MQFETTEKVGIPIKRVIFEFMDKLKYPAKAKFREIFWHLGAKAIRGIRDGWDFPNHVSNETIAGIIKNTCFVCGGLMQDGKAIKNDDLYHKNSGNTTVWPNTGEPKILQVRKCSSCGHSHT